MGVTIAIKQSDVLEHSYAYSIHYYSINMLQLIFRHFTERRITVISTQSLQNGLSGER